MFRKMLDQAEAGDNAGVLLRGLKREDVLRGQVLCKPGSVTPHTEFTGQIYVLTKEEGGRHTPFFTGYRPQFYFRTTDVTGVAHLPEGVEMVMPGDNVEISAELIHPIAMDEGDRFAIREGGHTVGSGRITKIIKQSYLTVAYLTWCQFNNFKTRWLAIGSFYLNTVHEESQCFLWVKHDIVDNFLYRMLMYLFGLEL